MTKKSQTHTANFIVSSFLKSKRCLNKLYNLSAPAIAILRYICDSIDLTFSKTKKFSAKLYHEQIAEYNFCTRKTVSNHIHALIKARLLKHDAPNHTYYLGNALIAWVKITRGTSCAPRVKITRTQDRGKNYPSLRYGSKLPVSNITDITKTVISEDQKPKKSKEEEQEAKRKASEARQDIRTLRIRLGG